MPTIIRASSCTHGLLANTKTWREWGGREEGSLGALKNTCGGCTGSWSPHSWFSVSLLPWARWRIDRAEKYVRVHLENRCNKTEAPAALGTGWPAKPRMRGTIQRHLFSETSPYTATAVCNKHFFNFSKLLLKFTWGHIGKTHLNLKNLPTWRF